MIAAFAIACIGTPPEIAPEPTTAHLTVNAWPADASVAVGSATAVGSYDAEVAPGAVSLTVSRPGFESHTVGLELAAGDALSLDVRLVGEPVHVVVAAHPVGASVSIRSGDVALEGKAPFVADVPGGDVTVVVGLPGMRSETITAFLVEDASYDVWLDPEGAFLDLLRVFPTGKLPKGAAITPDNEEIWVTALDGPPGVYVHALDTGAELAAIRLPPMRAGQVGEGEHGAVEVAFAENAKFAYVTQMESYRVFEIDTATREVTRLVERVRQYPKIIITSPDESKLYVSLWELNSVKEIDRKTMTITRDMPTVTTPRGLFATEDDKWLYVAGFAGGHLARIDLSTGVSEIVWSGGRSLRHLVSDGKTLYASDMGLSKIYAYDLQTGVMRDLCETDPVPNTIDLSPDGRLLFVSSRGPSGEGGYLTESGVPGSVEVFDTGTGQRIDKAVAGSQPTALDLSDDGKFLVVSDFRDDTMRLYAVPSWP